MAPLSHADVRRLKLVLDCGNELENIWGTLPAPSDLAGSRLREHTLERLVAAIHALEQADSENVRRLSFHTRNLTLDMTARHLATVLVPFERLLGKALRDDEILIDEGDASEARGSVAPMRLIADNLRSAFNVGALLRTAECFGVEHVSLSGYTPTPDTDKTARTSLGTEKSVAWSGDANVHDAIARAKRDGYAVIALETAREAIVLDEFQWPEKCALLLGNERFGLDRDVLDQADHLIKIPMHGTKNSLNVGIACGIALAAWRSSHDRAETSSGSSAAAIDHKIETLSPSHGKTSSTTSTLRNVIYQPIATFKTTAVHPYEAPRQASLDDSGSLGTIELPSAMRETLKDLDGFERVWLIYDFHHNTSWKPLVLPPRGPHEKRGVFATRSPYRPNSIGLSCVELVKIEGTTLTVRATDLLDGSPILDIKPYVSYADSFPGAREGWLEGLESERYTVAVSPRAESQLKWLEENGAHQIRAFAKHQLEFDPTDRERKRVTEHDAGYRLAYRTWRIDFQIDAKTVVITNVASGYSEEDLAKPEDKYGDKALHRAFNSVHV